MIAIFKRDFMSYMVSMIGCAFIAFVLCVTGIYLSYYCFSNGYPYCGDVLCSVSYLVMLAIPILTMKSFAEERKSKTDQLLFTSSVSIERVVMGKYLAMVAVWTVPIAVLCLFPLILHKFGPVNYAGDYTGILGVYLVGCAYIAMGMFISSITESTIMAAVITFAIMIMMMVMPGITSFIAKDAKVSMIIIIVAVLIAVGIYYYLSKNVYVSVALAVAGSVGIIAAYIKNNDKFYNLVPKFLNSLPLTDMLSNFKMRVFDMSALVYFLSVGFVFIFLTVQSIQKRRYS